MIYLPIVILLAAILVLIYLILRPDPVQMNKSKTVFVPLLENCHVCKKTYTGMDRYEFNGSPVKVCDMCKEYAERRAYVRR